MNSKVSTAELVKFLKQKTVHSASFLDNIKIAYRPYVCPFDDILNYMDNEKSVFDFGCGSGMLLSLIDEYKMPTKLGGCEITEELVKNANEVIAAKGKESKVYLFDGHSIPEEISNYDYITMIDVLHHIPKKNQLEFLKQLVGKMKVGSEFILKDIKKESRSEERRVGKECRSWWTTLQ